MPIIDDVRLEVTEKEDNKRILNATCRVTVSMSPLEACIARQCARALNEEFRISAAIYPEDLGGEGWSFIASLGSENLQWPESQSTVELVFRRSFVRGEELNEDHFGWFQLEDELIPKAEIRTREAGVFVTSKRGPTVRGFF